jgi:hypothetical protein
MPLQRVFEGKFPDESPLGYYRRLAQENRMRGWPELASVAGVSRFPSALLSHSAQVADALGLKREWTARAAERDTEMRKHHRFLRGPFDAVCPACLRESQHHRAAWDHVYVTACHKHKVILTDQCPRCQSRLSKRRPRIEQCGCGQDLRKLPSAAASHGALWIAAILGSTSGRASSAEPKLRNVEGAPLSNVLATLCFLHDPGSKPRRNAAQPKSISEALELLHPLEALLHDWPSGFREHVRVRLEAADPAARTLNAALGLWYQRLKREALRWKDDPFLAQVIQVANEHFPGLIGLDGAGTLGLTVEKPLSLREAAERLGLRRDFLASAIKAGKVQATDRRFGERKLAYQLTPKDVEGIRVQRLEWIDRQTAVRLLDVPESVLGGLVESGAVVFDKAGRSDVAKGGPYSKVSMDGLATLLRGRVAGGPDEGPTIRLKEINSRRVGDHRALRSVFAAIVSGALRPVGQPPTEGVGAFAFRRDEVQALFGSVGTDRGMTIEQVCRMTGWKYESVSHWIDEGLLQCESVLLRGQGSRVLMPEHLLRFMHEFVPLSVLARSVETKSTALMRLLPGLPLRGAKVLPNGARRGALVSMPDLVNALLEGESREAMNNNSADDGNVQQPERRPHRRSAQKEI